MQDRRYAKAAQLLDFFAHLSHTDIDVAQVCDAVAATCCLEPAERQRLALRAQLFAQQSPDVTEEHSPLRNTTPEEIILPLVTVAKKLLCARLLSNSDAMKIEPALLRMGDSTFIGGELWENFVQHLQTPASPQLSQSSKPSALACDKLHRPASDNQQVSPS